jgi:hypothetical protein
MTAFTNTQPRHRPSRRALWLLLCAAGQLEQQSWRRPWCGDIGEVESNRPKSPEAFDFTQTEAAIVWSGSGVCLGISPSNLPGLRSLASALCRARVASGDVLVGDGKQDTRERYGT